MELLPSNLTVYDGLLLGLLLAAYWLVDVILRREWLLRGLRGVRLARQMYQLPAVVVPAATLGLLWTWDQVPQLETVRLLALVLAGMITWKAVTEDVDVANREGHWTSRVLLLASTAGVYLSPAFLIPVLYFYSSVFESWKHHGSFPLRVLQATLAFAAATPALDALGRPVTDLGVFVFFLVMMQASHYFITAFAKGRLGPKWYSWMTDNQLHHISASAYSWGWARFLPEPWFRRVVALLKPFNRPFQIIAYALESLVPFALLDWRLAVVFAIGLSVFHVVVFLTSGIFFWEWVVTNALLVLLVFGLPEAVAAKAFGWHAFVAGLVIMLLGPLQRRLWIPMPLGWWDTPLTQRVYWRVVGESGQIYGVYNDFMGKHERLYGRVNGSFLVKTPLFTYHLGEVWNRELRDAIWESGGDPEAIEGIRAEFGIMVYDEDMTRQHAAFLRTFFHRLNCGATKDVFPRWLKWLKAPGGQFYRWGDLPRYARQEPVTEVQMVFREEFFDGKRFRRITEEEVLRVTLDDPLACEDNVCEVDEMALEAHLIRHAAGKLVDLPASWTANLASGRSHD